MTPNGPSVLIIPGAFSPVAPYIPLRDALIAKGVDIQVLHMPTVRLPNDTKPAPPMYDDAAVIARETVKLADAGKDVFVIAHSYGGVPLTQAATGLGKTQRKRQGKQGGIVGLGFITSLVPAVGQTAGEVFGGDGTEETIGMAPDALGWLHHTNLTQVAEAVFSLLPPEKGAEWAKEFSQHSGQSYMDGVTQAGYLEEGVSLSYLLCENDKTIPPQVQQAGIDLMEKTSGKKVDVTSIPGDHAPMISVPDLVTDWIFGLVSRRSGEIRNSD